jgi:hypothetical protein
MPGTNLGETKPFGNAMNPLAITHHRHDFLALLSKMTQIDDKARP